MTVQAGTRNETARPPWALILLGAALIVFFAAPLLYLAGLSIQTFVQPGVMSPVLTADNYIRAISDPYAAGILLVSLKLAAITTAGCVVLGLPLAMFVARERGWQQRLVLIVVASTLFTNLIVRAYGWIVFLGPKGALNATLSAAGLIDRPVRLLATETSVVLGLVQELLPVFVLVAAATLQGIERSLEEAALIAGARKTTVLVRVILPLAMPGLVAGAVLVFLMAMGSFIAPEILGGGRVMTIGTLIRQLITKVINYPFAAALAVLLIVLTGAVLVLTTLSRAALASRPSAER